MVSSDKNNTYEEFNKFQNFNVESEKTQLFVDSLALEKISINLKKIPNTVVNKINLNRPNQDIKLTSKQKAILKKSNKQRSKLLKSSEKTSKLLKSFSSMVDKERFNKKTYSQSYAELSGKSQFVFFARATPINNQDAHEKIQATTKLFSERVSSLDKNTTALETLTSQRIELAGDIERQLEDVNKDIAHYSKFKNSYDIKDNKVITDNLKTLDKRKNDLIALEKKVLKDANSLEEKGVTDASSELANIKADLDSANTAIAGQYLKLEVKPRRIFNDTFPRAKFSIRNRSTIKNPTQITSSSRPSQSTGAEVPLPASELIKEGFKKGLEASSQNPAEKTSDFGVSPDADAPPEFRLRTEAEIKKYNEDKAEAEKNAAELAAKELEEKRKREGVIYKSAETLDKEELAKKQSLKDKEQFNVDDAPTFGTFQPTPKKTDL